MHRKLTLIPLLAALTAALAMSGCGRKSEEAATSEAAAGYKSDAGILRFVPADTPYVFASVSRLPEDVRGKLEGLYGGLLLDGVRESMIEDLAAVGDPEEQADPEAARKVEALTRAFIELLDPETRKNTGIHTDAITAVYGVGLIPVLRIEVDDMAKLEATIERLEATAERKMSTATVGDLDYRYLDVDDSARIVLATADDYLVASFVPGALSEGTLEQVLGVELPDRNVADAGTLGAVSAEYGLSPYGAGYLDMQRIAATFLEPQTGSNGELLSMLDYDSSTLSDVCKTEFRSLAGIMPRIVAGYSQITAEEMASTAVFELRDDIAAELSALAAPVPGLGVDHGGLFSFGLGLDMLAARKFYEARLEAMDANPYECEHLQEMQTGFMGGRSALEAPMPPIVYGITGFLAVVDKVDGMDIATQQPPTEIDMSLLVATDNAAGLVAMGSLVSPELASMDLKPNGEPVEVPLPPMGQPFASAQLAMNDAALALSVGEAAGERVAKLVASEVTDRPPFMSMHLDMQSYYELTADMVSATASADPTAPSSADAAAAMANGIKQFAELFDRMSYDILLTERGVEMPSVVTLND